MSIQAYKQNMGKPKEYTFESLSQSVDELSRQVGRTRTATEKLSDETAYDLRTMTRLNHTQKDNKDKIKSYIQALTDLRRQDPQNPLIPEIAGKINNTKRNIDELDQIIAPIAERHEKYRLEEEEKQKKMAEEQAQQQQMNELQMRQAQQHNDVEFIAKNATGIVNDMADLNDLNHQLADKIDEQHEIVVHVDETIEEAKDEMEQGNKALEEAEEIQKTTPCCMVL